MADDLSRLRADVQRLRRLATRKVSRLKTRHDVVVSGTQFDPRRAPKQHARYTEKQLQGYKDQLTEFLSRENQYVPDASKRPIPRAEWQEYKATEKRYADMAGSVYDTMKDVKLPSGETVQERLAKMNVLHKRMHNPVTNPFYDPHDRPIGSVTSRESLKKLGQSLEKKSSPGRQRAMVRDAKDQLSKMLEVVNNPALNKAVQGLTNNQFIALWNYTSFAGSIAMNYVAAKKMLSPKDESWAHEIVRQQSEDALGMVEWVKGQQI